VQDFLHGGQWSLTAEFLEIESGKNNARRRICLHDVQDASERQHSRWL
jgi:hypothetical protein